MTGKEEEYRASAIRALCTILDVRANLALFFVALFYHSVSFAPGVNDAVH